VAGNIEFIKAEPTQAWLSQFDAEDQNDAIELLRAMTLVSRDELIERLRGLLLQSKEDDEFPIGLYAEREIRRFRGVPNRIFKEPRYPVRRAYGAGPTPISPTRSNNPHVGSEGIIAQLIGEVCRQYPKKFVSHPGPNLIRQKCVRRFVLVTDFVGTGARATSYLSSAWRSFSIKSWRSSKYSSGLRFEVVAYSMTDQGRLQVEKHRSKPKCRLLVPCPTISDRFRRERAAEMKLLCERYAPKSRSIPSLGYGHTGALIAFAHGAPNNVPAILQVSDADWKALFPKRITESTRRHFRSRADNPDAIRSQLVTLRETRLAKSRALHGVSSSQASLILVLAACVRPPRNSISLSQRTGMTTMEIDAVVGRALAAGFITGRNQLTTLGHNELSRARKMSGTTAPLPFRPVPYYCPKQLRAPRTV
jgi:hypothetical protein